MLEGERLYRILSIADKRKWKNVILINGKRVSVIPVKSALSFLRNDVDIDKALSIVPPTRKDDMIGYNNKIVVMNYKR